MHNNKTGNYADELCAMLLTSWSDDLLFLERKMTKTMLDNLFSTGKYQTTMQTNIKENSSNA